MPTPDYPEAAPGNPTNQPKSPPVVLTIAGSDNSAGAGVQADLKAILEVGCYGLTAITCVVAEVPGKVYGVQPVRTELLAQQIRSCFEAFPVAAVKTGMLYSNALIRRVVRELRYARELYRQHQQRPFSLVVDPVMVASSGDALLKPEAVDSYRKLLLPMADVVTPNVDELRALSGKEISDEASMCLAGRALREELGVAILCKGGHLAGAEAVDWLLEADRESRFSAPYLAGAETHGTGCTYSAGIAARLACGHDLHSAVAGAKAMITRAIREAYQWRATRALAVPPLRGTSPSPPGTGRAENS